MGEHRSSTRSGCNINGSAPALGVAYWRFRGRECLNGQHLLGPEALGIELFPLSRGIPEIRDLEQLAVAFGRFVSDEAGYEISRRIPDMIRRQLACLDPFHEVVDQELMRAEMPIRHLTVSLRQSSLIMHIGQGGVEVMLKSLVQPDLELVHFNVGVRAFELVCNVGDMITVQGCPSGAAGMLLVAAFGPEHAQIDAIRAAPADAAEFVEPHRAAVRGTR